MAYGARFLRRGDTCDIECSRSSRRLRLARSILERQGVEWNNNHVHDEFHDYGTNLIPTHHCADDCDLSVSTPWATDELLGAAYRLADLIQTERGAYERSSAYRAKVERERTHTS